MTSSHLSFVCNSAQAIAVRDTWGIDQAQRVAVCLDEGLFSTNDAREFFRPEISVVGRSELGLSGQTIFEQAVRLADDLYDHSDGSWPTRVNQWLLESHKRWFLYALHSAYLIESAFTRFKPTEVWIPEHPEFSLTLSPDTEPSNPLFFDLLASVCRRQGIIVHDASTQRDSSMRRSLIPIKYVAGEWIGLIKNRKKPARGTETQRPVMIGNLDNDFHRQFDLGSFGVASKSIFAWVRESETIVPVEQLLDQAGLPGNTRFAWLHDGSVDLASLGYSAGVTVRRRAGLRYLLQSRRHQRAEVARRTLVQQKHSIPWLDILLDMDQLPAIHKECRVAAAYYCVFEYERARSVLKKWKPELYVTAADHWPYLPHIEAAKSQKITTLSTESGLSLSQDNFAQKRADTICVFGKSDAEKVAKSNPAARVVIAGDALAPSSGSATSRRKPARRVLFAMSGRMFGWWFGSLIFDYPAYEKALIDCAEGLRRIGESTQIVIKSHPVSDLHELYDKMVDEHSDVFIQHRKEPMSDAEIAEYDVAVVFGAATAFIAELIRAGVPVVYFTGPLTEFGKNYHKYDGLEVATNVDELNQKLTDLLDPKRADAREATLQRNNVFFDRFVDPKRRSFPSVLEEVLPGLGARAPGFNDAREAHLPQAVAESSRVQP